MKYAKSKLSDEDIQTFEYPYNSTSVGDEDTQNEIDEIHTPEFSEDDRIGRDFTELAFLSSDKTYTETKTQHYSNHGR